MQSSKQIQQSSESILSTQDILSFYDNIKILIQEQSNQAKEFLEKLVADFMQLIQSFLNNTDRSMAKEHLFLDRLRTLPKIIKLSEDMLGLQKKMCHMNVATLETLFTHTADRADFLIAIQKTDEENRKESPKFKPVKLQVLPGMATKITETREQSSQNLFCKANSLCAAGKNQEAIDLYHQALALSTDDVNRELIKRSLVFNLIATAYQLQLQNNQEYDFANVEKISQLYQETVEFIEGFSTQTEYDKRNLLAIAKYCFENFDLYYNKNHGIMHNSNNADITQLSLAIKEITLAKKLVAIEIKAHCAVIYTSESERCEQYDTLENTKKRFFDIHLTLAHLFYVKASCLITNLEASQEKADHSDFLDCIDFIKSAKKIFDDVVGLQDPEISFLDFYNRFLAKVCSLYAEKLNDDIGNKDSGEAIRKKSKLSIQYAEQAINYMYKISNLIDNDKDSLVEYVQLQASYAYTYGEWLCLENDYQAGIKYYINSCTILYNLMRDYPKDISQQEAHQEAQQEAQQKAGGCKDKKYRAVVKTFKYYRTLLIGELVMAINHADMNQHKNSKNRYTCLLQEWQSEKWDILAQPSSDQTDTNISTVSIFNPQKSHKRTTAEEEGQKRPRVEEPSGSHHF